MQKESQAGYSMVELLIVVVIIAIISSISIHYFITARKAAENSSAIGNLGAMRSAQMSFYTQRSRYARLDELNAQRQGGFGDAVASSLRRGRFTYQMTPETPTDAQLKNQYTIIATRDNDTPIPYIYTLQESGRISGIITE